MNRFSLSILAATAVLMAGSDAFAQIQQTGHRQCQSCQHGSYIGYQSSDWTQSGCCRSGNCSQSGSGPGICRFWTASCLNETPLGRCCATKAYPDAGWAPPARLPVNYDYAWYAAYHPQAYYGNAGGGFIANYPVVYQPTDTTQLGYYYHNVPTWQTRPGMIPATPRPSDYHARMCPGSQGGCYSGAESYGNSGGGTCQNCNSHGYAMSGHHYTTPGGSHAVRPAAHQKQGLLGGFRFASLTEMFD